MGLEARLRVRVAFLVLLVKAQKGLTLVRGSREERASLVLPNTVGDMWKGPPLDFASYVDQTRVQSMECV